MPSLSSDRPSPSSVRARALGGCVLALLTLTLGCHRNTPPPNVPPTSAPLAERIHGLPVLPTALSRTSPAFQRLFEGIDVALEDRVPLPDLRSEADYRAWVERELATWLGRRARAIEEAESRLAAVNAADGSFETTVGSALVGALYEQTARDVIASDVPPMREERARAIRTAWRDQMEPMLARGAAYFARCANATRTPAVELAAWAATCRDHARREEAAERATAPGAAAQ